MARTIRRISSSSLALTASLSVTLAAAGCTTVHDVGETQNPVTTCAADESCRLDEVCDPTRKVCLRPPPADQLDILFVIDNSPSMMPLQEALAYNIPRFLSKIDATGADYHVAITTTDVGGQPPTGAYEPFRLGSCNTRNGDDGVMQATACASRGNLSAPARNVCARLCPDPKYVPTDGSRFISKTGMKSNVPSDFQVDPLTGRTVDFGPANAFKCMAVVGDIGCGVEAPLEAAKRALDGHALENQGFLRPNSLLAVIFITDEDDCSAQDAMRGTLWTPSRDCSAADPNAPAECFNTNYRCLAKTLRCTEALNTAGAKTGCVEQSPSFLSPIAQYTSFLKGLRPSNRLFVGGIWNLGDLARSGRMQVAPLVPGSTSSDQLGAQRRLCGIQDPRFSEAGALPQLRLSKFAQGLRSSIEVDLCDIERYPDAIDSMATSILLRAGITPPG
jgi:hypothetical protein